LDSGELDSGELDSEDSRELESRELDEGGVEGVGLGGVRVDVRLDLPGPPPSLPEINAERNTPIPHIKTCRNKYLGGRSSEIATPQPPKTTPKSLKTTNSTHCIEYQGGVDQLDDILSIPTIIGPIGQILMEL
jgi:hypothetical protein